MKLDSACLLSATIFASFDGLADALARGATAKDYKMEPIRQLMQNGGGGGSGDGGNFQAADNLVEQTSCKPFNQVDPNIMANGNTEPECLTNTCPGGCCRLFAWSVCDEDNALPQLQCICNENTSTPGPTVLPTPQPTPPPTVSMQPTAFPTKSPSPAPTNRPTPVPTSRPTTSPMPTTDQPTMRPTTLMPSQTPTTPPSPDPSSMPSFSPTTAEPSASPTSMPSASPSSSPTTAEPSSSPSGAPSTSPPTMLPSSSPSLGPTITPFTTEDTIFEGSAVRQSTCLNSPPLPQFVQTTTYAYSYEVYAQGAAGANAQNIVDSSLNDQIHDAVARRFMKCTYEDDDLWIIQSAPQVVDTTKTCRGAVFSGDLCFVVNAVDTIWVYDFPAGNRRLQATTAVVEFVTLINSYLNNEMAAGSFSAGSLIGSVAYINDGSNPIVTKSPTGSPSASPSDTPTSAPNGSSGGAQGFMEGVEPTDNDKDGLPAAGIAALVVALVVFAVFIILAISRHRRNRREREIEYLEKADLDIMHQVTSMEDHIEIDSNPGDPEMEMGMGMVRRTPTHDDDDDDDDLFTSPSRLSKSPSKRSQRGPLHSQDELDKVVGNHRGNRNTGRSNGRPYMTTDTVNL